MGWYHAVQLLDGECESAKLTTVVEPWFLGGGKDGPGSSEFKEWSSGVASTHGVTFLSSMSSYTPSGNPTMALISGRTADNPSLLTSCISLGCSTVYLEKPGAPSVSELQSMKEEADAANVKVLMGYNKNVCKYVSKVREVAEKMDNAHVTFVSNNAYENTPESLGECFERNSEGMLKNMVIHELALLVSFYDVTVDNIATVEADREFSSCRTLKGPSGEEFTDFDKIKFTVTTKTGTKVSVAADRCGGEDSYATVTDPSGSEVFRWSMPDDDDKAMVKDLKSKYPDAMPYFFPQHPDYIMVKERVADQCANNGNAEGVATIEIGVKTLKVAEFLTPELQKQLLN